jgi:hypothetical protein
MFLVKSPDIRMRLSGVKQKTVEERIQLKCGRM